MVNIKYSETVVRNDKMHRKKCTDYKAEDL